MTTLYAIVGATGTGKTKYSIELAKTKATKPHIINADSMQFYQGMDIGTAKLTEAEKQGIPHHFFDVLNVTEEATVAWYQPAARKLIKELLQNGHDVILVGGSGLYISSVIYEFDFPPRHESLRKRLNEQFEQEGITPLLERLQKVAPEIYATVDHKNPRRVIRALEVAESGQKLQTNLPNKPKLWYPKTKIIGIHQERSELVKKLDARVLKIWQSGFIAEVKKLIPQGIENSPTAAKAIGYQQAIAQINGQLSEEQAIEQTQILTRRYARRQVSWFKRYPEIEWVQTNA